MKQIWLKDGKFSELSENEAHGLAIEEKAAYMVAKTDNTVSSLKKEMEGKVGVEAVEALKEQFGELSKKHVEQLENAMLEQGKSLAELRKSNDISNAPKGFDGELNAVWAKSKDSIANFINEKSNGFSLNLKTEVTRASVANNTITWEEILLPLRKIGD